MKPEDIAYWTFIATVASTIINALFLLGVAAAVFQLAEAQRATKIQMTLRLIDEWRSPEILKAINYIHNLRRDWKSQIKDSTNVREAIEKLAEEWVKTNANNANLDSPWGMRRTASQFLAKTGLLVQMGYINPNDFFGIVPETGRLLFVLIPIENAIQAHFIHSENQLTFWDKPFNKWEFLALQKAYMKWAKTNRKSGIFTEYIENLLLTSEPVKTTHVQPVIQHPPTQHKNPP